MDRLTKRIAIEIHRLRVEHGLSQVKLAKAAGVSPAMINRLEDGLHKTDVATLMKISHQLGVEGDELIRQSIKTLLEEDDESGLKNSPYRRNDPRLDKLSPLSRVRREILDALYRVTDPDHLSQILGTIRDLRGPAVEASERQDSLKKPKKT